MRILSEASDLNISWWRESGKKVEWWLGVWVRDLLCRYWISTLQLLDSQLECKVRALSVCYYLQICWLFFFLFSQGNVYWVRFQFQGSLTSYYVPDTSWNGTRLYFPSCWQIFSMSPYENRTPIFLERLAISLIRYDQRNLQNRRQIFLTRPTGAQTKSESVGVRMTSHLFTACFLFKDRTESRKVQPPSNWFGTTLANINKHLCITWKKFCWQVFEIARL